MTYLVQLVEVRKNDCVFGKVWEYLFAHRPPAPLFLFPIWLSPLSIRSALPVVTAEESIATVDNVLAVDPLFIRSTAVVIQKSILHVDVATPGTKGLRGNGCLISEEIVAPFCSKSSRKPHERHLHGRSSRSKHLIPGPPCVAVEVDKDVNTVADDLIDESLC